jgi:hypothetical protein
MGDDMLGELSRGKFSRGNRRVVSGSVVNVESWVQNGRFKAELKRLDLWLSQLQIGSRLR